MLDNLETPWDLEPERRATEGTLAALAVTPGLALLASFRGRDRVGGPAWALVYPVDQLMPPFDNELFCRIAQRLPGSRGATSMLRRNWKYRHHVFRRLCHLDFRPCNWLVGSLRPDDNVPFSRPCRRRSQPSVVFRRALIQLLGDL